MLQPTTAAAPLSLRRVAHELLLAVSNRSFRMLFLGILSASAILGTANALEIYVNTYFWGLRPELVALRLFDLLPHNGDPRLLYILVGNGIGSIFALTLLAVMMASMVADALDSQEPDTGRWHRSTTVSRGAVLLHHALSPGPRRTRPHHGGTAGAAQASGACDGERHRLSQPAGASKSQPD